MSRSRSVLVVDDEVLIAMTLEDMLDELGCRVVGPALTLEDAVGLAREADIEWAILDLSLDGKPSLAVAEVLRGRNIPFVFASGYAAPDFRTGFETVPVIHKPFDFSEISAALDRFEDGQRIAAARDSSSSLN